MQQSAVSKSHDTSVAFSLRELQELERKRLADVAAAREAQVAAAAKAKADAEAARVAAEEAKLAAEREARYRVEVARVEAARQERLAVEAVERAARERHEAELAAARLAEELAIKKIEAQKKRPRWMIAVTALAILASAVLVVFTIRALASSSESTKLAEAAKIQRDEAIKSETEAVAKIAAIRSRLAELDQQVNAAVDRVAKAQTAAEAKRAAADAQAAREQAAALRRAADLAEAERQRKLRNQHIQITCLDAVCK